VKRLAALAALITLLALPATALAASCPRTSLADVENEVMCPVCGTPLSVATDAPQAQRERAYVERLIADCRTKDQIKQALVAQFGDRVLALPGDEGTSFRDVMVYVVPALAIVLALAGVGFAWIRWRRARVSRPDRSASATAETGRLDADMDRYEL
jgi:cytochrome c-type biogenesis protein CcmH